MSWRRSMKRGEKEESSFAVCFGDAHTHSFARARAPSTGPDLGEISTANMPRNRTTVHSPRAPLRLVRGEVAGLQPMEPAQQAEVGWAADSPDSHALTEHSSFANQQSTANGNDVIAEIDPTAKRPGVSFVELKDVGRPLTRRPSKLSRSGTLNSLSDVARHSAAESNQFKDFNHHNWLMSMQWIFKGEGMHVFVPMAIAMAYATIVVVSVELSGVNREHTWFDLETDVTVGMAASMALLLAFRLNVCFSRWWEGRLLWGSAIVSCRSIVTMSLALEADFDPKSPEAAIKRKMAEGLAGWSIAFVIALKHHLRGEKIDDEASGWKTINRLLKAKGVVPNADLGFGSTALQRLKQSSHPPLHCLRSMRHVIRRLVKQTRECGHDVVSLENGLNTLSGEMHGALTGCERILRTPCPPGYVGVLRVALLFFLMLLPFVLLETHYLAIVIVGFTAFVLLGAEEVAIQLEQPFGDDANDLPLDTFCFTLEADLMTLLNERLDEEMEM